MTQKAQSTLVPTGAAAPLMVGREALPSRVILAPMSGITDLPFRRQVRRFGPQLLVTEMVASAERCRERQDSMKRAAGSGDLEPLAVQLVGRDPYWMGEAAKLVEGAGARIIDINMGCPARKVVGGHSGSALMREPDLALDIINAVVDAVKVPVTLKMRTGWNDDSRNAPELALRAEEAGITMVTVHGRTRCQFYNGKSDWVFIGEVKNAVSVPVIANGDITSADEARLALGHSGADGVMIGRGAQGAPWLLRDIDSVLTTGAAPAVPSYAELRVILDDHYDEMLSNFGADIGHRAMRKHFNWYLERLPDSREVRSAICRQRDSDVVRTLLDAYFDRLEEGADLIAAA